MEGRRLKPIFTLLAVSLFGLAAHQVSASPITIGFDKGDIGSTGELTSESGYAGLEWDSRWGLVDNSMPGYGALETPTDQFLSSSEANIANVSDLFVARRDPFDFLGASLSTKSGLRRTWYVEIKAFAQFGEDASETEPAWETGWLSVSPGSATEISFEFKNVRKVIFNSRGGIFTMDDFKYQDIEAKVNEAGGLILLGIGLVGLWAARRRIRA